MLTPEASSAPSASPAPAPVSVRPVPPRANGELILVADDQDSVRHLLVTVLNDHGYQTVTAADGQMAIEVFRAHADKVVAVVTDIHMPNIDGAYLADHLRAIREYVPILFMSGIDSGDPFHKRPVGSESPFLLKPFRPIALLEALHRLLHRQRKPKD